MSSYADIDYTPNGHVAERDITPFCPHLLSFRFVPPSTFYKHNPELHDKYKYHLCQYLTIEPFCN